MQIHCGPVASVQMEKENFDLLFLVRYREELLYVKQTVDRRLAEVEAEIATLRGPAQPASLWTRCRAGLRRVCLWFRKMCQRSIYINIYNEVRYTEAVDNVDNIR